MGGVGRRKLGGGGFGFFSLPPNVTTSRMFCFGHFFLSQFLRKETQVKGKSFSSSTSSSPSLQFPSSSSSSPPDFLPVHKPKFVPRVYRRVVHEILKKTKNRRSSSSPSLSTSKLPLSPHLLDVSSSSSSGTADSSSALPPLSSSSSVLSLPASTFEDTEMSELTSSLLKAKQQQCRRLRSRPVAALPRKHWLYIQSANPYIHPPSPSSSSSSFSFSSNLSGSAPSIFVEDDGRLEEKLKDLRKRRKGIVIDKTETDDKVNRPFWQRKSLRRKSTWELPPPPELEKEETKQGGEEGREKDENKSGGEGQREHEIKAFGFSTNTSSATTGNSFCGNRNDPSREKIEEKENTKEGKSLGLTKNIIRDLTDLTSTPRRSLLRQMRPEMMSNVVVLGISGEEEKKKKRIVKEEEGRRELVMSVGGGEERRERDRKLMMTIGDDVGEMLVEEEKEQQIIDKKVQMCSTSSSNNNCIEKKSEEEENTFRKRISLSTVLSSSSSSSTAKNSSSYEIISTPADSFSSSSSTPPGSSPRSAHSGGLEDAGASLISELKRKARDFDESGVDPSLVDSLRDSLKYYPGIEKQQRRAEMLAYSKSFEEVLEMGRGSVENFTLLIKAHALKGDVKYAMTIHDKMKLHGFEPDVETYVALIQAATAKKDAAMSRVFFLKMRSQLIAPTERLYGALIKAHVVTGDLTAGFALMRKMEDEGLTPTCVIYTILIDGLVKANLIQKAWRVFHDMRTWKTIVPDEVLFTVMIKACAKTEETEKALNVLEDMKMSGLYPTDITYTELIHACCGRKEYFDKTFDFYNQMLAEDMPISPQVFTHLLQACGVTGNVKRAKKVVEDMGMKGIPLTVKMYEALIFVFANGMQLPKISESERLGHLRCAWHVIANMKTKKVEINTLILNAVLHVYINGGYAQYAIDMLQQYAIFNCEPNEATYAALLKMLAKQIKDPGRFFALWDFMRQKTHIVPSESLLHLALASAMDSKSAARTVKVLREMYEQKIFPTPQLTDRLAKVGRQITEIHQLISDFIKLQKEETYTTHRREQSWLQANIDQHELQLFSEGRTLKTAQTPEEKVRKKYFDKKKKLYGKKTWLPLKEYKESKQKGGEAYAKRHDRPQPNLVQP